MAGFLDHGSEEKMRRDYTHDEFPATLLAIVIDSLAIRGDLVSSNADDGERVDLPGGVHIPCRSIERLSNV